MPDPDEEPPGSCWSFHGLRGCPYGKRSVPPRANSVRLSLPIRMPPASLSFATTVESSVGTWPRRKGRARGGEDACRVELVLHREGNAVERPAPLAPGGLALRSLGLHQRALAAHGDESTQPLV